MYNWTGVEALRAMVMAIEAGEMPGKTIDGGDANGHPANKIDGTHFRGSLPKQYARLAAGELVWLGRNGERLDADIAAQLRSQVQAAIGTDDDWSSVVPEVARDVVGGGEGATAATRSRSCRSRRPCARMPG